MADGDPTVLIAGGGIAGLSFALTCHQVGIDAVVFESAAEPRPLGVGINLQPNAVRELIDLGLEPELQRVGVATEEYGFYTKFGDEIWVEPRGTWAGYAWPQYSVHRGELQMALYRAAVERLGSDRVLAGHRVTGYENHRDGDQVDVMIDGPGGPETRTGSVLVGADGLHSAVRSTIVPAEGPPEWRGAILWRGATRAKPFRGGASMALIGHATQRFVTYPISPTDPDTGEALINWIAELTVDPTEQPDEVAAWNRRADAGDFIDEFTDWRFDWIDCPALIEATDEIFVYQMVDRDPLDRWRDGRVTLIGDAAHVMTPVGSNGASQSIVDGRRLARALLDHGVGVEALDAYEAEVRPATSKMVLQNRGKGPDLVMDLVEERSGGIYDDLEDVLPYAEREAHAAKFKGVAGLSIDELNASPPIIPPNPLAEPTI